MKIAKDGNKDKTKEEVKASKDLVDRKDVELKSPDDLARVLKEELVNYPNRIEMKVKASDISNFIEPKNPNVASKEKPSILTKIYQDFAKDNRTHYGNVEYGLKGNQPGGRFSWKNPDDMLDIAFEIKYVHYDTKEEIPAETLRYYKEESQGVADKFVRNEIKGKGLSDAEKVLKINNYLAENAEYNHESIKLGRYLVEDHTAYGVLVKGIGVCESYAKAFDLLAQSSGVETIYVTGDGINPGTTVGEAHAWNMVKLDGEWYNIDTTWNDIGNTSRYDYFLKPDSIMNKTHKRANDYNYPEANGSKDFIEELNLKN